MCWWAVKGSAGHGEGERPDDDDGGRMMAGRRGGMMKGVPQPRMSMGNGGLVR